MYLRTERGADLKKIDQMIPMFTYSYTACTFCMTMFPHPVTESKVKIATEVRVY